MLKRLKPFSLAVYIERIIEKRWTVMAVCLGLTLVLAGQIPRLLFKTAVNDLIIEDLPEAAQYEYAKKLFGSEEIIRIVVKCDNVFDPKSFRQIDELARAAEKINGVRRAIHLPGIKKTVDPSGNWPLEKFAAVVGHVDLFAANLIAEQHNATAITLVLKNDAHPDQVITNIQQLIDTHPPTLSLYQIGMPLVSQALAHYTQRDFLRLPPITFALIALMLLVLFRRPIYVLLPMACVFMALIATFGAIAVLGIPLSMLTMIVPVFLIAVGTAYCLHIISEHRFQAQRTETAAETVAATFGQTVSPTVLAVFTTVFGLCSLFLSRISAINEFALFACIGMFCFLAVLVTFLPAALSLVRPAVAPTPSPQRKGALQKVIDTIVDLNLNRQRTVLTVIGLVVAASLIGLLRLRVETNPVTFFKADTPVRQHFNDIYQQLSGSFPVNIVMSGPKEEYFEKLEHLQSIEKLQQYLDTLPGVDKTISMIDYMKLVRFAANRFEPKYYKLPDQAWEMRMLFNSYRTMLGKDMLTAFMNPTFSKANILLLTHIASSRDFLQLREKVLAHVQAHFSRDLQWDLTGFGMVISASSHHLTMGQIKSLSMTLVLIFAIMFALFLSWKVGMIAILPNLFPIVVTFGLMGWLGLELSMATSLIASVAIGLAVDDTIHYLVHFNREFKKDLDDRRALKATLNHIGRPIIFTSLTISIGFSILLLSGFKPTAIFGLLMVVTMISALIGDLILLPALMLHVELVTLWDLARIKLGTNASMQIPLFHGLTRTELHTIFMAGTLKPIRAGEVLFRKGDASDSMFTIISGEFEVIDVEADADDPTAACIQKKINTAKTGDVLGEMGLLRAAPRSATVIASQDGELLPVNWKMIKRLQWLYPPTALKFSNNIMTILCDRVERLTHCLASDSLVDDLTRLCNRKGLCSVIEKEISRAARYRDPLTLCLLQVQFGGLSDSARNSALQTLIAKLTDCIRGCDTVSRVDTDLLALLLPQCPNDNGATTLARLNAVAAQVHQVIDSGAMTIMGGMTAIPIGGGCGGEDVIRQAIDQARADLKVIYPAPETAG